MWRVEMRVRSPLLHGSWIGYNRELEEARLIPNLNGLYERASRENAVAFRTASAADHFGTNGIGNASAEHQFGRRRNLSERDHLAPDFFGRRLDIERSADDEDR